MIKGFCLKTLKDRMSYIIPKHSISVLFIQTAFSVEVLQRQQYQF